MIRKIVVINSKGGCGKTTLSTNLASFYAVNGYPCALFDYDPQDSATRWLSQRPDYLAKIHGVAAAHPPEGNVTRSFQMRVPPETQRIILDTPASMKRMDLVEVLRDASAVIVPVLPSFIDCRVTSAFIRDLSTEMRLHAPGAPIATVANRVRRNTRAYHKLLEFLDEEGKPPVACLRDSQYYVNAAAEGMGVHEIKASLTREDRVQWQSLINWLETGGRADTQPEMFNMEKQASIA
jgi:chromosome partitioning protein